MKTRFLIGATFVLGLGLLGLAFQLGLRTSSPPGLQALYGQSSEETQFWVFDGHMHPTWSVYYRGGSLEEPSDYRFALPLALKGGLGASFFNTSIDEFFEANNLAVKEALRQFDHFYREIAKYPNQIGVATNGQEIRSLREEGKIAAILTVEGALAIESDLGVLRMFHRLGLREMNLVHILGNNIGDSGSSRENDGKGYGLTEYGRELVAEMNRLGMLIDLSHAGEQTIMDVMDVSTQPVATTHSAARALGSGWSDEMIRKLAGMRGVICVPFLPQAVSRAVRTQDPSRPPRGSGVVGLEPLVYRGDPTTIYDFIEERKRIYNQRRTETARQNRTNMRPLSDLIDHIDYIVRLVGVDYVGIASDFGGYPVNIQGIENAGEYQNVAQALLERGYSREDVAKIMGENLLRLFDEVVGTAQ